MANHERVDRPTRRDFLKLAGAAAAAGVAAPALAHHHPKPTPQSIQYLDKNSYIHNMEIIAHFEPGTARSGGVQIMNYKGARLAFQGRDVIDVSDPRNPKYANKGGAQSGELSFHQQAKKWVIMTTAEAARELSTPYGKYDPAIGVKEFREFKGLRGIRMWDATDPMSVKQLCEYSTGQTGSGAHIDGSYYDGGKYAYVAAAPDDSFTNLLSCILPLSHCVNIIDLSDPAAPKPVTSWWVPGQRNTEMKEMKKWQCVAGRCNDLPEKPMTLEETVEAFKHLKGFPALDRMPYTQIHGPSMPTRRIEDGGRIAYGAWSAFGMLVHDFSDIKNPKLIGKFDPSPLYGGDGIPFHTIWLGTESRGFTISVAESLNPDCNESWLPLWVIDVRDPRNPVPIAQLPRPRPPKEAPYTDFCFARGRFSSHISPNHKAPGRFSQNFFAVSFFNAGLRCYDVSEPLAPKEVAYFMPPRTGTLSADCRTTDAADKQSCIDEAQSFSRPVDNVFVEWDRRLIYAGTTNGLYILSCPALGTPVLENAPVREWTMPGLNAGAPV